MAAGRGGALVSFDDQPQDYDPMEAFKEQLETYVKAAEAFMPRLVALRRQVAEADLRDDFAKFALEGILSSDVKKNLTPDGVAQWAYRIADAMLVARKVVNL